MQSEKHPTFGPSSRIKNSCNFYQPYESLQLQLPYSFIHSSAALQQFSRIYCCTTAIYCCPTAIDHHSTAALQQLLQLPYSFIHSTAALQHSSRIYCCTTATDRITNQFKSYSLPASGVGREGQGTRLSPAEGVGRQSQDHRKTTRSVL